MADVSREGGSPSGGGRQMPDRDRPAPGRVCVQAAPLGAFAQGPGPAGGGQKTPEGGGAPGRRGVTAASTRRRPGSRCHPDRRVVSGGPAPAAGAAWPGDLYMQEEVEVALHPTLTRVWSRAGRAGQRRVQAPGKNYKRCGFGLVDWREGWLDFQLADGRRAAPLVAQLRRAVARSQARGKIAMVILDNLGVHTPKRSRLLRACSRSSGSSWCWSTPPPTTPTPTASSGCGGPCAARSPTPTSVSASKTWQPTPTGGRKRSLRPRCCRRSAARSHPTSSRS